MHRFKQVPLALALGSLFLSGMVVADPTPQALPFAQDWSDSSLVSANDDWSGVPGILGYRGDALTGATNTNPQTILADGTGVLDINANQTAPNTFGTGGVAEFELADPTIALTGSGTADAPFILLNLNTSGWQAIQVGYPRSGICCAIWMARATTPCSRWRCNIASAPAATSPMCRSLTWPTQPAGPAWPRRPRRSA
ncbi:MAG: hypothetical protein B7Y50_13160 [Hydrogenophilales bacterium 28-61-11]|nr:MAG: hypothetical protein B7Y50_13160 [Hydrogenophilales bacterium 28-61-11]